MHTLHFISLSTHMKLNLALCFSKTDNDTKVYIKYTISITFIFTSFICNFIL
jgi:hypothetical protein